MASNESQARQKRVLPSRSRRGGPGVGTCDIDVLILDTQKRKGALCPWCFSRISGSLTFLFSPLGENEPLIPAETRLLLTTNSALVASSSTSKLDLNEFANERYFDRPEVMKTFREQQTIETPEFSKLSEDAGVGSRFRPRAQEDVSSLNSRIYMRLIIVPASSRPQIHQMLPTRKDTANTSCLRNDSVCARRSSSSTNNTSSRNASTSCGPWTQQPSSSSPLPHSLPCPLDQLYREMTMALLQAGRILKSMALPQATRARGGGRRCLMLRLFWRSGTGRCCCQRVLIRPRRTAARAAS